jgi:hypothetical protein
MKAFFVAGIFAVVLAVFIGENMDTDWAAVGVGFVGGMIFMIAFLLLAKTFGLSMKFLRRLFEVLKQSPPRPARSRVQDAQWRELAGQELTVVEKREVSL